MKKMQEVQNKVIRVSNTPGPRTRINVDILGELNMLNDESRVKQLRLNHVHKLFYDLRRTYLKENFFPLKDVHQYSTTSNLLGPHFRDRECLKAIFRYVDLNA